ncbi:MAG: DNA polymerase III subunit gamma/tau [Tannerella sp.]|jgi:DNA polymerase-3 subunit gamma/tau|nr:DNA polymerase III subunit gamma/tau [Tannerella sp.]
MDNYIVSARKYRPSTFKSVVGQKALTTTLKNAIRSGKLAHAYLFCGPRGVGKTSCARIFAKTINCLNLQPEGEACNECESCRSFNEQRSLNIHELDAASNNSVDDIRSLTEQVRIPPQLGKYKVYIIDEVHMLSTQAFNAFLKTLEEPPHHAIFILATTEKQKILPTILSRCQTYDFTRITLEDIVEHLQYVASCENITAEPEALNVIAQKADGGMRDALSIFDQVVSFTGGNITYKTVIDNLNVLDYEYYFRITDAVLKEDVRTCMLILNEILEKGFDGQNVITGLAAHFRDLLVCKDEATLILFEVGASIRERYKETAKQCPDKLLFKAIELANMCDLNYRNSRNKRLLLELTLIQLCQLTANPSEEDDKKKMTIKPVAAPPQQAGSRGISQAGSSTGEQPASGQRVTVPYSSYTSPENVNSATNAAASATPYPSGAVKQQVLEIPTKQTGAYKIPTLRSTSLKDLVEEKEKTSQSALTTYSLDAKDDFSQEVLLNYWLEYAEGLTIEKIHLKNTLTTCKPILKENFTFEISVYNPSQKNEISDNSAEILGYLCNKLHNTHVKMDILIVEKNEKEMIYTSQEKYNYLIKKNPNLEKLTTIFNLTIE